MNKEQTKKENGKPLVVVGLAFIAFGLGAAVWFTSLFFGGIETTGTVHSFGQQRTHRGGARTVVNVQYVAGDIHIQSSLWLLGMPERARRASFSIGDEITIIYATRNPNFIIQSGFIGIRGTIISVAIMFVFGGLAVWAGLQEIKRKKHKAAESDVDNLWR
ncbi:MAG: DUF3592 domain-containing protein [Spirochaetes bacterium]|nr:DUF3592 domain-containing protein [Spirochaetota bacterium]